MSDDTNSIEIDDNEFFLAQLPSEDRAFPTRNGAVDHLKDSASGIDTDPDSVTIIQVSYGGDDWEVKEVPWKEIALMLLGVDDE